MWIEMSRVESNQIVGEIGRDDFHGPRYTQADPSRQQEMNALSLTHGIINGKGSTRANA